MPTTYEMAGSPTEEGTLYSFRAERRLKVAWADRAQVLVDLLTPPGHVYPYNSEWGNAYCVAAGAVGRGKMTYSGGPIYAYAEIVARYATPSGSSGGGGSLLTNESVEPSTEHVTLDHSRFRWTDGSGAALQPDEAPGRLEVGFDWVVRKFGVLQVPTAVVTLVGKVNDAIITSGSLGLTFAAETLLYRPPSIERVMLTGGQIAVNIAYHFTYRANGWNKFWRAESGEHERIYIAGGSQYDSFPQGNFLVLL